MREQRDFEGAHLLMSNMFHVLGQHCDKIADELDRYGKAYEEAVDALEDTKAQICIDAGLKKFDYNAIPGEMQVCVDEAIGYIEFTKLRVKQCFAKVQLLDDLQKEMHDLDALFFAESSPLFKGEKVCS